MTELPITSFDDSAELPITSFGGENGFDNQNDLPVTSFNSLTTDDILKDPMKMVKIRQYMKERKGVKWAEVPDKETLETFMSHMRFFSTNELRTISEARYIQNGTEEQKAAAAEAYKLYDEIGPLWENGEGWNAVGDYAKAVLTSPSTYLGALVGKIASVGTASVARAGIIAAAKQAAKTGGIEAAKSVLAAGARQKAITTVAAATATDMAVGAFQDIAYQDIMKDAGVQEDHSYLQTGLSMLGGAIGGGVAALPLIRKGTVGITNRAIRTSKANRVAQSASNAAPRVKKAVEKLAQQAGTLKSGNIDWTTAVAGGAKQMPTIDELANHTKWFFDVSDPNSFVRIVIDSGAPIKVGEGDRFTSQIVDFVSSFPQKDLDEINDILEPAIGLKLGELVDRIAIGESAGGSMLRAAGRAKQYAKEFMNLSAAKRASDEAILNASQLHTPDVPTNPQYLRYMQSLWRRMLVSHPGTTAINIQGWGMAYMARTMAEIVDGSVLGSMGMVGKALGQPWGDKALKNSKALFQNQVFKARTLLDPYDTRESFDALARMANKKIYEKISKESSFGLEIEAPKTFGITEPNMAVRTSERVANIAARASFIKLQDVYTKSFSGISELDKQVRLAYGKGLTDLINAGEHHKITDEMWEKSLSSLLKDTFSYDYTKVGPLHGFADVVEKWSNLPGVGLLFPFGRFMNNNLGFVLQYSPLSFVNNAARMKKVLKQEGISGLVGDTDLIHDVSKMIVGTVGLATLLQASLENQEEGKQWFEVEESTGDITSEQNMAPISNYRIAARIIANLKEEKSVPQELWVQLGEALGPWQWAKELSGTNPISQMIDYFERESNPDEQRSMGTHLYNAFEALSGQVISGFTRPLDPANKVAGMLTEEDALVDRRQADEGPEAVMAQLTKYTDNLFELALDENLGTSIRSASRPEGEIHDPNPMATLVGRKEVAPKNYTDKMLGMVNIPAFIFDQRTGIPEADRFLNGTMAPILNNRAKALMEREDWKKGTQAVRLGLAKTLLANVRDDVRGMLQGGLIGTSENQLEDQRRIWLTQPAYLRDEARKDLNIGTPDRDLTREELLMLRDYVGSLGKYHKNIAK